jgi:hypothetical protein
MKTRRVRTRAAGAASEAPPVFQGYHRQLKQFSDFSWPICDPFFGLLTFVVVSLVLAVHWAVVSFL